MLPSLIVESFRSLYTGQEKFLRRKMEQIFGFEIKLAMIAKPTAGKHAPMAVRPFAYKFRNII